MANYRLTFSLPFQLSAYEHVTLKERLERELKSFFDDKDIKANFVED